MILFETKEAAIAGLKELFEPDYTARRDEVLAALERLEIPVLPPSNASNWPHTGRWVVAFDTEGMSLPVREWSDHLSGGRTSYIDNWCVRWEFVFTMIKRPEVAL